MTAYNRAWASEILVIGSKFDPAKWLAVPASAPVAPRETATPKQRSLFM